MAHIIFLNGPPRSGKDTIAKELVRRFDAVEYKISRPLKQFVQQFFGLTKEEYLRMIEAEKDIPQKLLFGKTPREVQIALSETFAKPLFGESVLGELAARSILAGNQQIVAISDSGFSGECVPIIRRFGRRNCSVVHVHREGCTFAGDSRGYVEGLGVFTQTFNNRFDRVKDKEMFDANVERILTRWYNSDTPPVLLST